MTLLTGWLHTPSNTNDYDLDQYSGEYLNIELANHLDLRALNMLKILLRNGILILVMMISAMINAQEPVKEKLAIKEKRETDQDKPTEHTLITYGERYLITESQISTIASEHSALPN